MAQFKIYGRDDVLRPLRTRLSDTVHAAAVDVLGLPTTKRFHRFFPMTAEDFPTPEGRSAKYTILEIVMFTGRTVATKKAFYQRLYRDFADDLGIPAIDLDHRCRDTAPRLGHPRPGRGRADPELPGGAVIRRIARSWRDPRAIAAASDARTCRCPDDSHPRVGRSAAVAEPSSRGGRLPGVQTRQVT